MTTQYIDLAKRILTEGEWVENERTGTKCLVVINADLVYDVGAGEFPIVTTRKSFWKSAVAELLGYIKGCSNASEFRDIGTKTWDANAANPVWTSNPYYKGDGDMGLAYRFRTLGYYNEYTPKIVTKPMIQSIPYKVELVEVEVGGLIGSVYNSKTTGRFRIIEDMGKSEDKRVQFYKVQFLSTGYITVIQKSQLGTLNVKDPYYPSVNGIACHGEPTNGKPTSLLKKTWSHMISRCYNKTDDAYHNYGAKGVFVDDRWLIFSNFVEDFKRIYNWQLKLAFPNEYSIDKDWCGCNVYSSSTCRWSTKTEQARNTSNVKTYKVSDGVFVKGLHGIQDHFKVSYPKAEKLSKSMEVVDKHLTYTEVDQIKAIYAKLKIGMDDRGLIATAWHPHLEDKSCLRSCMFQHHFSLLDGTLYLNSYQRSCDVPLGLNFNMVQCYVLLAVMAQITGHKAGKVFHKIVNAHAYGNQVELLKEQVSRDVIKCDMKFAINPEIKTLEDLETATVDDFNLDGYEHHDPIQYPFSV